MTYITSDSIFPEPEIFNISTLTYYYYKGGFFVSVQLNHWRLTYLARPFCFFLPYSSPLFTFTFTLRLLSTPTNELS